MPRRLTREEQETIISRTADEDGWNVYTCDPVVKRRLSRLAIKLGVSPTIIDRDGVEFTLPLMCVRFMTPVVVSAQEKANRRERGKRLAAARSTRTSSSAPPPGTSRPARGHDTTSSETSAERLEVR